MGVGRAVRGIVGAMLAALSASSAFAQGEPVGPCSPYRAADGDIPSEMPGCARRPVPGSLADELEFRRARTGAEAVETPAPEEDAPSPHRPRARRPRPR